MPEWITKEIYFYRPSDKWGFLSNFWPVKLNIDGNTYASMEHYYQSKKAMTDRLANWIAHAPTPYLAKVAGNALRPEKKEIVGNWDDIRLNIMEYGLYTKFESPQMRLMLRWTGDAILHEDSPDDMFWGCRGEDHLGKLIMKVRDNLNLTKLLED